MVTALRFQRYDMGSHEWMIVERAEVAKLHLIQLIFDLRHRLSVRASLLELSSSLYMLFDSSVGFPSSFSFTILHSLSSSQLRECGVHPPSWKRGRFKVADTPNEAQQLYAIDEDEGELLVKHLGDIPSPPVADPAVIRTEATECDGISVYTDGSMTAFIFTAVSFFALSHTLCFSLTRTWCSGLYARTWHAQHGIASWGALMTTAVEIQLGQTTAGVLSFTCPLCESSQMQYLHCVPQ